MPRVYLSAPRAMAVLLFPLLCMAAPPDLFVLLLVLLPISQDLSQQLLSVRSPNRADRSSPSRRGPWPLQVVLEPDTLFCRRVPGHGQAPGVRAFASGRRSCPLDSGRPPDLLAGCRPRPTAIPIKLLLRFVGIVDLIPSWPLCSWLLMLGRSCLT
jgi:hypothetical protein